MHNYNSAVKGEYLADKPYMQRTTTCIEQTKGPSLLLRHTPVNPTKKVIFLSARLDIIKIAVTLTILDEAP